MRNIAFLKAMRTLPMFISPYSRSRSQNLRLAFLHQGDSTWRTSSLQLGATLVVPFTASPYHPTQNRRTWRLRALRAAGIAVGDIWRWRPRFRRRRFRFRSATRRAGGRR
jgi:hypothetical protein